ncbi:hypothetical protein [Massilia endophytica]|uniref:hypothetical protein n=1 Tax=Massilia endophytica TaxID=2899220 RepID=UPI001E56549B|nr:hypothetical protein [Massilia endophytica]UGQ46120.1 hypothetical protein LSQ66_20490 [Massilia endophytica]
MGIFSKFRKNKEGEAVPEDDAAARRAAQAELQRELARATALKIDAIEAAMAADIFDSPEPVFRRPPRPAAAPSSPFTEDFTTELLEDEDTPAEAAAAESAPLVEEVAILYANGELEAAGLLLRSGLDAKDRMVWWMLFDLYQILGRQEDFDSLSLDYAAAFETSPPPWNPPAADQSDAHAGAVQTVVLSGLLDEQVAEQIGTLRATAAQASQLRLELGRLTGAEPVGCALLLQALNQIERPGLELALPGADVLCGHLRALPGLRDKAQGEAPWLLLLELLRLQNLEQEFEDVSMDYCLAFEVSPPPFRPPQDKVEARMRQPAPAGGERFVLPEVIHTDDLALLGRIAAYAERYPALVFDCSRLARIEFGAANQLLAALQALPGRRIEFRALNHLAAALLRLVGMGRIARLQPHRY